MLKNRNYWNDSAVFFMDKLFQNNRFVQDKLTLNPKHPISSEAQLPQP